MLKIDKISKFFFDGGNSIFFNSKKVEAVKNVSIEIYTGDTLGIIGESGSGKSTLLNLIGLLDTPSSGTIFLNGKKTKELRKAHTKELVLI